MFVFDSITQTRDFQVINSAFPQVGKRIERLWGEPEFQTLIHQLLWDSRGGSREGFPANVTFALARLETKHARTFPELTIPPSSMYDLNNYL